MTMKTQLMIIISCALLLLAAGCKQDKDREPAGTQTPASLSGNEQRPAWAMPDGYDMTSSMTAVVRIDLTRNYAEEVKSAGYQMTADDMLAAFDGNETCLGVAEQADGLFWLYIAGNGDSTGRIRLRYYSAALKNVFVSEEFAFVNDTRLGTVNEPYTPLFTVVPAGH